MEDDLCERVRRQSLEMPGARQSIADFLVQEGSGIKNLTMSEVADLTFTSKPSLVRFAKALGFDGWRSFRLAYVEAVERSEKDRATGAQTLVVLDTRESNLHPRIVIRGKGEDGVPNKMLDSHDIPTGAIVMVRAMSPP